MTSLTSSDARQPVVLDEKGENQELVNLFVGVPVKLGKNGVEQIIEISLTSEERGCGVGID